MKLYLIMKKKKNFINKNKHKFIYLNELKCLDYIYINRKILINKAAKYFINSYFFKFLVLLSLGEIYRIIIYFIGCSANFTIKKVVSSRNDLSGAEYSEAYDKFNPQLQIFGKEIKFEQNSFIHIYQSDTKITPE